MRMRLPPPVPSHPQRVIGLDILGLSGLGTIGIANQLLLETGILGTVGRSLESLVEELDDMPAETSRERFRDLTWLGQ